MKTAKLLVRASNSTVNGRRANAKHSAVQYFDGWRDLGLDHRSVFKDGKAKAESVVLGIFLGHGEYLHVPVMGKKGDHRRYRVRCRFVPGNKYKSRKIVSVFAKKLKTLEGKKWHWVIETK